MVPALMVAMLLALAGCSSNLDADLAALATDYADAELNVSGSKVTTYRRGGECVVAEVATPDDQTYRVILVAQSTKPQPYEPIGISQMFTLDEFVPSSDVGCGIMKTDAYGKDANGDWAILG